MVTFIYACWVQNDWGKKTIQFYTAIGRLTPKMKWSFDNTNVHKIYCVVTKLTRLINMIYSIVYTARVNTPAVYAPISFVFGVGSSTV